MELLDLVIGPFIIIQSLDGTTWLYGDLQPITGITLNQILPEGAYISKEGNPSGTGSTGYHVHVELEMLSYGEAFKYGYNNSSNPCIPLGLPNQIGGPYIYDGTPVPIINNSKKWLKARTKRIIYKR